MRDLICIWISSSSTQFVVHTLMSVAWRSFWWFMCFIRWHLKVVNHKQAVTNLLSFYWFAREPKEVFFFLLRLFKTLLLIMIFFRFSFYFSGSRGLYEQLWQEVSQRGSQVSFSQWAHQNVNTKGTEVRDTGFLGICNQRHVFSNKFSDD